MQNCQVETRKIKYVQLTTFWLKFVPFGYVVLLGIHNLKNYSQFIQNKYSIRREKDT